jgi:uncharacterized protein involved in outer membrane biogenesis
MRAARIAGWTAAGVALVLLLAAAAIAVAGGRIAAWAIEHPLSHYLDRTIKVTGPAAIHWGSPTRIVLNDLRVQNAPWSRTSDMLAARRVEIQVYPRSLLSGPKDFPLISIEGTKLLLETSKDGQRNWAVLDKLLSGNPRSQFPIIKKLEIRDSALTFRNGTTGASTVLVGRQIELDAPDPTGPVKLLAQGTLQNLPYRIAGSVGPLAELRNPAKPYPVRIDGTIGESRLTVEGTMGQPLRFSGLDLRSSLEGRRLHDVAAALDIPLPPLPDFRATGVLTGGDGDWVLKALTAKLGTSDLEGGIEIDMRGKVPALRANFTSSTIDLADFTGFLGKKPAHSSAPPPKAEATDTSDRIVPATPLALAKLPHVNADVAFDGERVVASKGLPLQRVSGRLLLKDGILSLHPLRFGIADGTTSFDMRIAPAEPARIDLDLDVRHVDLHKLVAGTGLPAIFKNSAGTIGGFVQFTGTGASLRDFLGSMNGTASLFMENGRLSRLLQEIAGLNVLQAIGLVATGDQPVPINCMVARFDLQKGLATARTLMLDTTDTLIVGKGNFNFAAETLYVDFDPYHKHFTPLTLRTPIEVRGTFAKPDIRVSTTSIVERLGAAIGLGVLLPPIGALLPLVDTGLGPDNACRRAFSAQK